MFFLMVFIYANNSRTYYSPLKFSEFSNLVTFDYAMARKPNLVPNGFGQFSFCRNCKFIYWVNLSKRGGKDGVF